MCASEYIVTQSITLSLSLSLSPHLSITPLLVCALSQTAPVVGPVRRPDTAAVHTRKSIEGLNQEISFALEGMQIILPVRQRAREG